MKNDLYMALKSLLLVLSEDSEDYPDDSSYRQVQDRIERAKKALEDAEEGVS